MKRFSILLVDDEERILNFLKTKLKLLNYEVYLANNGIDAIEQVQGQEPDMVVMDVIMPKMDGLQLLASLKASPQWHRVPVVMITTEGGETKVAEAVRLGAAGYVRKPFTADQIKEKLVGILESAVAV